jgi:hypothetical protein
VYGEALVAQLAKALATSIKLDKFIIERDSSIVVSALQNPAHVLDWHIENVIIDTLSSFSVSSIWEARKINRSANFCVHYVTYRAAVRILPSCIPSLVSPPNSIPIYLVSQSLLYGRLEKSIEVQTSVSIMWHIGLR